MRVHMKVHLKYLLVSSLFLSLFGCKAISQFEDGPYVFYLHDTISIRSVITKDGKPARDEQDIAGNAGGKIHIKVPASDSVPNGFEFDLDPELKNQPSTYKHQNKLFVVSDIEGEFPAFRRLLMGNGIMDSSYAWTFGDG